ncbi:MAG: cation transporter [Desulfotomaculaceae bacterium]|nr:cation transporter [Desulfotomaculaceae bacterium]
MEQIVLKVVGMSCSHCQAAVEKALKDTSGVREAAVDLGAGVVTVQYEPGRVARDSLIRAIADAGYEVKE